MYIVQNDAETVALGLPSVDDSWGYLVEDSEPHIYANEGAGRFCCGISEWGEFSEYRASEIPSTDVTRMVERIIEVSTENQSGIVRMQFHKYKGNSEWSNSTLMKAVLEYKGFRKINNFVNPNTGNEILEVQLDLVNTDVA